MFLQSVGLLPDNVIILSTSRGKAEERIGEKLANMRKDYCLETSTLVKQSLDETDLHLAAVKEIYKGFYCEINSTGRQTHDVIDEIAVRNQIYL